MICLIADVGGTNMRIAQTNGVDTQFTQDRTYPVTGYDNIDDVINQYCTDENINAVQHVCVAIACPINGDQVSMTNHTWSFSIEAVKKKLNLDSFLVINDFTAQAMCLPFLTDENKIQVGGDKADLSAPMAVYGPGTGLGVAHLIKANEKYIPLPGEGGHVDFASNDELEQKILNVLQSKYGHVSVERLVSGPGILEIYQAICHIKSVELSFSSPADITKHAVDGTCEYCKLTLDTFCRVMGSFGGNLALTTLTYGGVYIAGGIIPRFIEYFKNSDFRTQFEAKGRFTALNKKIPVFVITEKQPGLLGAAAYLTQNIEA
ncbi:glucokinase [Algibacillus agarilyticus]|uniref:glucokinase n=1 Tax=Algibacillus agarilyticus TaxID=2234133 RepID=UPI000DD0ED5A|nr:glucokinase [Algibacillus agarilyticus]